MTLHCAYRGEGRPLLAVHGWGLNGGIWEGAGLEALGRVAMPDLPGCGRSPPLAGEHSLSSLRDSLLECAADASVWVGWSLGGLVALHAAATRPGRVRALVLVSMIPRFVTGPDWPHAQAPEVLEGFARSLAADYRRTLLRFLALQVLGADPATRATLPALRARLFDRGAPDPRALREGLRILAGSDLREAAHSLGCPVLVILGERDTLVPAAVDADLRRRYPDWRVERIRGAGHAPFLSHPRAFRSMLSEFLNRGL